MPRKKRKLPKSLKRAPRKKKKETKKCASNNMNYDDMDDDMILKLNLKGLTDALRAAGAILSG